MQMKKHAAEGSLSSSTAGMSASPVPTPSIEPTFAPGKRGPAGMGGRTNYSRVNTGAPPQPDAGASAQKAMPPRGAEMLPKIAGEGSMGKIAGRPGLQQLVKSAMATSASRASVTAEARIQSEKLASGSTEEPTATRQKLAGEQAVEKLAGALEFLAEEFSKEGASLGGQYNLTEHLQESPPGVMEARSSTPLPDHKGQGKNVVPMHPAMQKDLPAERGATQMEDNMDEAHHLKKRQIETNYGKKTAGVAGLIRSKLAEKDKHEKEEDKGIAEAKKGLEKMERAHESEPENKGEKKEAAQEKCAKCGKEKEKCACGGAKMASGESLVDYFLRTTKVAEDAINPAKISAGPAVPPETSEAGQPGGHPVGGSPKGPTNLVGSTDEARHYTKGDAYKNRREDLRKYFEEPAMSAEHDKTLQVAFENTGKAGPKIASVEGVGTKTAAAKVLLAKLAQASVEGAK